MNDTAIRPLFEEDLDALLELRSTAFPGVELEREEYRQLLATRLPHSTGLFVGSDLACSATVYPVSMYFAGHTVRMGALAGVAAAPQYRRRGLVRTLLLDSLERMKEAGIGWSLEFPFDPRFYHRFGWQSIPSGSKLDLPIELLFQGAAPTARRLPTSEFPSLAPIYDEWAQSYSFTFTRKDDSRESWTRIVGKHWLDSEGFLYELEGAYVLFTLEREGGQLLLTVEDYAFQSPAGRQNLFAFLGSMQGQVGAVRILLPDDDPLSLDNRLRHFGPKRWPVQARIVDLQAALGPLSSLEPRKLRLRVDDELCEWNNGVFEISTGPGGTVVEAASGESDAVVPITSLPLLLTGTVRAASLLAQGRAGGDLEALEALSDLGDGRPTLLPTGDDF